MSQTISGYNHVFEMLSASRPVVKVTGTVNAYGTVGTYMLPIGNYGSLVSETLEAAVFGPPAGQFTITNSGTIISHGTSAFDAGIGLGSPGTIINTGKIKGGSGIAVIGGTGSSYIENSKLIDGTIGVGVAVFSGLGTVANSGTIYGQKYGAVALFDGGLISNKGTGTLSSGAFAGDGYGISAQDAPVTVQNAGTIIGYSGGIKLQDGGFVTNSGFIHSDGTAVSGQSSYAGVNLQNYGTVLNSGTITGESGIVLEENNNSGSSAPTVASYVKNTGFIDATSTEGLQGLMTGDQLGIGIELNLPGTVVNAGSINASDNGIRQGNGMAYLLNTATGRITSGGYGVYAGGALNNAGYIRGVDAGFLGVGNPSITNSGVIEATGTTFVVNGVTGAASGVAFLDGGELTNLAGGTVSAVELGVFGAATDTIGTSPTIVNGGLIEVTGTTVVTGGTFAFAPIAIDLLSGGAVTNQVGGVISGYGLGIFMETGFGIESVVDNSGTIRAVGPTFTLGGVVNDAIGVDLFDGGTLINRAGGLISGYIGAYAGRYGDVPSYIYNAGSIDGFGNSGVILGAAFGGPPADLLNKGYISGAKYGAVAEGGGNVTNTATITGGGEGVIITNTGANAGILDNFGNIFAPDHTFISRLGQTYLSDGVVVTNNGTVENQQAGSISGDLGVLLTSGATLINAGTVTGAVGAAAPGIAFSVVMTGNDERVIVDPGAVFNGIVFNSSGTGDVLELAGPTFSPVTNTLSGFGSEFSGFSTLAFDPATTWSVNGYLSNFDGGELIDGFGPGDVIVLTGTSLADAVLTIGAGGILAIPSDSGTADISFSLADAGLTVTLVSDGPGGSTDIMLTSTTWKPNAGGAWGTAADWTGGTKPGPADNVVLTSTAAQTITYNNTDTVNSILSTDDKLAIQTGTLQVNGQAELEGALSISSGALLELDGVSQIGSVSSNGKIYAGGGSLVFTSAVTGGGKIYLQPFSEVEFRGAAPATQTVIFDGVGSTLAIDNPVQFKAALSGFSAGSTVDFTDLPNATFSLSGTTLSVTSGAALYTESINSLASNLVLVTGPDGHGGSEITAHELASASPYSPAPVNFGTVHVGASLTQGLTISNTAPDLAGGYSEGLDGSIGDATGAVSAGGTFLDLAAGLSSDGVLYVSLSATNPGLQTGTAIITLDSEGGGIDGHGTTALPSETVHVSGAVYAYAAPSLTSTIYNLGVVHVGQSVTQALSITDMTSNAAYTEGLDAGFTGSTGSVTDSGTIDLLGAGLTNNESLIVTLNTGTSGTVSGTAILGLTSDGAGTSNLGTTALGNATVSVSAIVDNYALANVAKTSGAGTLTSTGAHSYTLNMGSVLQGASALTTSLEVLNGATGLADLLSGNFAVTSASSEITNTGISAFSGLAAGQADTAPVIKLSTGTAGSFTETIVIDPTGSNASGYSGTLSPITLTVTGVVAETYTLTAGADDFVAGPGNDLFIAANDTLNQGDTINGGGGTNTLELNQGGTFDLASPTTFTNIQLISAQEAVGTAAQTITLRNGFAGTLTAASGTAGAGITIFGADDSAIIKLGNGNDTVTVGANTETITSGTGNSVFQVTSATSKATITGGTGSNTLAVSGGGTVTMGTGITHVKTVTISDNGVSGTNFVANTTGSLAITAGTGTDTITLGAATQSVTAGGGTLLVKGVIGDAGARISTTGTNTTFDLTTGGTGTLNAADTDLTVTLNTATNLTLSSMGFIHAIGSSGADTITAMAANQTLTGGLGLDTLVGYSGFGDVFLDTAAGLNGDTIKHFGGSDVIDITNINSTLVTSFGYSGNSTSGTLTISDGVTSAAINMIGNYSLSSFSYVTDNSGGTLIKFV